MIDQISMQDLHQLRLKKEFEEYVASLAQEPPIPCEFKIGDEVIFTNEFGVEFDDFIVIGFAKDDSFNGRFIHAAMKGRKAYSGGCAYWFPKHPGQLRFS